MDFYKLKRVNWVGNFNNLVDWLFELSLCWRGFNTPNSNPLPIFPSPTPIFFLITKNGFFPQKNIIIFSYPQCNY